MSWSVSAHGKVTAVRKAIAKQFETSGPCSQPEESIRQSAKAIIDAALDVDPKTVADVSAAGSMSTDTGVVRSHSLTIKVDTKWGFLDDAPEVDPRTVTPAPK